MTTIKNELRKRKRNMTKQNPFLVPFRQIFLSCRFSGVLREEKCECCGNVLLRCGKYGGICSSKYCKEERIKERWRMIDEIEKEIGRVLDKLKKTKFIGSDGNPTEEHTKLWVKLQLLKKTSVNLSRELDKGTVVEWNTK